MKKKERRVIALTRRSTSGQSPEFSAFLAEKLKFLPLGKWEFPRGYLFQSRNR